MPNDDPGTDPGEGGGSGAHLFGDPRLHKEEKTFLKKKKKNLMHVCQGAMEIQTGDRHGASELSEILSS